MCDLPAGTLGGQVGTRVPFSHLPLSLTFPSEQFWGRAARASWVRKNPDARLIFRRFVGCADTPFDFAEGRRPLHTSNSICGNGEVHCDASLRFHGLPVLDVGLEMPLLHRLASRGSEDARATQDL